MIRIAAAVIFLVICPITQAGWFGESNYDDCILENIQGAQNPEAVTAVKQACRNKFPERPAASAPASDDCRNSQSGNGYGAYDPCRQKQHEKNPTPEK